jgi:hypothetical protein
MRWRSPLFPGDRHYFLAIARKKWRSPGFLAIAKKA